MLGTAHLIDNVFIWYLIYFASPGGCLGLASFFAANLILLVTIMQTLVLIYLFIQYLLTAVAVYVSTSNTLICRNL